MKSFICFVICFVSLIQCIAWNNFTSNVAIIIVDTHNQTIPSDKSWIEASVKVIDNLNHKRNSYHDHPSGPNSYDGDTKFRLRGHSTRNSQKKGYNLKLETASTLMGFPKSKTWVLYGSGGERDKSYLKNYWIFNVARSAGDYASRATFAEVFVKTFPKEPIRDQYRGLYVFLEKIDPNPDRVAINKASDSDPDEGYITAFDQSTPDDHKYPGPCSCNLAVYPDIPNKDQKAFGAASLNAWCKRTDKLQKYINFTTFSDVWLFEQLQGNTDSFTNNMYFHKQRGEIWNAGPLWDMDVAMAEWMKEKWSENFRWADPWQSIMKSKELAEYLCERWYYLRCTFLTNKHLLEIYENAVPIIREAVMRENKHGWEEAQEEVRKWIKHRPGWIDENLEKEFSFVSKCKPKWYPDKCEEAQPPLIPVLPIEPTQNATTEPPLIWKHLHKNYKN